MFKRNEERERKRVREKIIYVKHTERQHCGRQGGKKTRKFNTREREKQSPVPNTKMVNFSTDPPDIQYNPNQIPHP